MKQEDLDKYNELINESRKRWPEGKWNHEPDRLEWEFQGFPCLIQRAPSMGALCGYVGVAPGHPWYGKGLEDVDADCPGGITYAQKCSGTICHAVPEGTVDDRWWIGFDCAHFGDYVPGLDRDSITKQMESTGYKIPASMSGPSELSRLEKYKDIDWIKKAVMYLAIQAAEAEHAEHA